MSWLCFFEFIFSKHCFVDKASIVNGVYEFLRILMLIVVAFTLSVHKHNFEYQVNHKRVTSL